MDSARTQGDPGSKVMCPLRQALDSTAYGETRGGAIPSDDPRDVKPQTLVRAGRGDRGIGVPTGDPNVARAC